MLFVLEHIFQSTRQAPQGVFQVKTILIGAVMPYYSRDTLHWESYEGRKTLIKDLDVRHLINILNHVKESNEVSQREIYPPVVCRLLETEGVLRIMTGWAEDIGIPRKNEDGSWELINQTAHEKAVEEALTLVHKKAMAKQQTSRAELIANIHHNQQLN